MLQQATTPRIDRAALDTVNNFDSMPATALVSMSAFLRLASCSRATAYRLIRTGRLPKPRDNGGKKVFWTVGQVRAFLAGIAGGAE